MAGASTMPTDAGEIAALESMALQAMQAGDMARALAVWEEVTRRAPDYFRAHVQIGQLCYRAGDFQRARAAFEKAAEQVRDNPQYWVNVALACKALQDDAAEDHAIRQALTIDPLDLLALIMRAEYLERHGDPHKTATAYGAVAAVAPPLEKLHPDLRAAVVRAFEHKRAYDTEFGSYLDRYLSAHYETAHGEDLGRFRDSLDIMVGRKRRFESHSHLFHYAGLVPAEFFPRERFPWLDAFEADTAAIRDEFLAVLAEDAGFSPYIQYASDAPLNQWAELNRNPRWSAFHLIKQGARIDENAGKCPRTMALLATAPQPDQPGRTPSAMFSLLKPHTRIPPHTGVSNVRLVVHVPLIVPPGCGFRVGNEVRAWEVGKAWVFDDTIEHEAWNDGDAMRTVLIFDCWHPGLSAAERYMITALATGIQSFVGATEDVPL